MKRLITIIFFVCLAVFANSQPFGMKMAHGRKVIQIPFELHNNLIVVSVRMNKVLSLKFIVDTGAQYTILTRRELTDLLDVSYGKRVTLYGSDRSQELEAHLAYNLQLDMRNLTMIRQTILVLDRDYLNLEYLLGVPVHGVMGTDIFKRFVVKVDYQRRYLTLYERQNFKVPKDFQQFPIEVVNGKPYIRTPVWMKQDTSLNSFLLLDSGASPSLVLHPNTDTIMAVPEELVKGRLGFGLGGELEGFLTRISRIELGPYQFNNLVANFQELPVLEDSLKLVTRNGFIGGGLLHRFTCIFDFSSETLFLKPNRYYDRAIKEDLSGMVLYATGQNLNTFLVKEVVEDSPAFNVGLKPNDEILRINRRSHRNLNLRSVNRIFQSKPGRKIKITFRRTGVKRKTSFTLNSYI